MNYTAADFPVHELTIEERLTLLGRVWDSLLDSSAPPIAPWRRDELRRRVAAADAEPAAFITLDELRRELEG